MNVRPTVTVPLLSAMVGLEGVPAAKAEVPNTADVIVNAFEAFELVIVADSVPVAPIPTLPICSTPPVSGLADSGAVTSADSGTVSVKLVEFTVPVITRLSV